MASIFDTLKRTNAKAAPGPLSYVIQFGTEKVTVTIEPSGPRTLQAALEVYARSLGCDMSRPVQFRQGSKQVSGETKPEPGAKYVASVQHERKG